MARQPYLRINFNRQNPGRSLSANQIVGAVKEQMTTDNVAPGCRLPPVRVLAHQLGISKNTVQTAYDELAAQGLVESKQRIGLFVASDPQRLAVALHSQSATAGFVPLPPRYAERHHTAVDKLIDLSSVFIDPELLPRERSGGMLRPWPGGPNCRWPITPRALLRQIIAERLRPRALRRVRRTLLRAGSSKRWILSVAPWCVNALRPKIPPMNWGNCSLA